MAKFLVLDIGGTFIKYAIMNSHAQFLIQGKVPAQTGSEEEMLASLVDVRDAVAEHDYEGVAISMPGRIDTARGWAHTGGAFAWLHEYPAAQKYGEIFGKRCTVANDGKCAASAESWTGSLADVDSGVVLVLGTGIGGGIVLDGKVWMGCSGGAGELSLFTTDFMGAFAEGERHHSQNWWTSHISALSISRDFARRKGLQQADGIMLFDAYEAGDEDAAAVLDDYAKWAAAGILSVQSVLDVERYAIGGGISARPAATKLIREKVDWLFDDFPYYPFSRPQVVTCTYGNEANLIGALAFHMQREE